MDEETLIEYPSEFPIKIMGESHENFTQTILDIVVRYAPDFVTSTIEIRPSKNGKYTSITCTINATSREQLDNLYRELSAHPMIKIVL
ncbi:HP0495 family protein [Sulfurirhabdus autotrophica]|uniref:UPF0250 protein EDC63_104127 n=1 Tax=Sulfurirhabdus autotrophica TaxID=1706046 RepID=A0A4R3Y8J0_9PROT|nr:DUF493 domain-containing protein [Sulfurirhabdus autotrophica]TCV88170.1 hypothetical protein EDC63_104127 [Sulfurirhabdus autotrophica]